MARQRRYSIHLLIATFFALILLIASINRSGASNNAGAPSSSSSSSSSTATATESNIDTDGKSILKYLAAGDVDSAHYSFSTRFARSERNPNPLERTDKFGPQSRKGFGLTYTARYKLEADLEQAQYLAHEEGVLQDKERRDYFSNVVVPIYEKVLKNIPPVEQLSSTHGLHKFTIEDITAGILNVYNRAIHTTEVDEFELEANTGNVLSEIPIFSDYFDADKIQQQWFGEGEVPHDHPGVVIIDDILSPEALARIQKVMQESTVWYETKPPKKVGRYQGAYIDDGLHDRILLMLAFELRRALPRILKDHPPKYLWAYKYESSDDAADGEDGGTNLHADMAAVNVNIWLTPDHANLDRKSGGLVVYTVKPPEEWDVHRYNQDTEIVYDELIAPSGYANVTVPYRCNRAVMFDSALFHRTDKYKFKTGYQNRRINLTILYGEMNHQSSWGSRGDSNTGKTDRTSSTKSRTGKEEL